GPIFNEGGSVCGVICSSFQSVEDDPEYISYGSLIWPALGTSVEVTLDGSASPRMFLLYDLVKKGFIATDQTIANITIVMEENDQRTISINY
ncbi:MAG TPA: hypothetical protein VM866_09140, partial [Pyrinomonadaceae bacterium]|nr:hypothetical protein [Pyrinomonadaceae bacterium]